MAAYERRFPTCKMIPVFVGSEILNDNKSEDGAIHAVERRCKLNVDAPYILKKIVGVDYVIFIQKNSLDRRSRVLKIEAHNESFSSRIVVKETCVYSVHPENPNWTCFEQSASLDVKSFFGFETTVEKIAIKQYSLNIKKGKEVIEFYINELLSEGITHIAPFEDQQNKQAAIDGEECNESTSLPNEKLSDKYHGATSSSNDTLATDDSNFKLDTDYIERCLGELTPIQESQLVQLRRWVADAQKGKVPNDSTLLRFLRARDFNLEKAREMLCHSLSWRKKYQVDRILNSYTPPHVIKEYFPGGWHHCDKDGRPLYILRLGQMDVKGLLKSVGEEGILKMTLHICEQGLAKTEAATRNTGKPVSTWTCLVDLDGLNMRHLWRPGIRALLRIIEIVEANYPETMGRVLIVRAPRVFPVLWTLVSKFIDENTRQKFLFYGGNDYQGPGGLVDYMNAEYIPTFLEGQSKASIPDGGLVPKSYYMSIEEHERAEERLLKEDSSYHSIALGKGQVHEIVIQNMDKGAVICWDFDVLKQDVAFNIYFTTHPVRRSDSLHSNSMNPLTSSDPSHSSHLDKTWQEGVQYSKVEPSLTCHDGESIQGSHVTAFQGNYILQWKYYDPSHAHHTFDIMTPKAKLMYYHEVLKSQDFRGSMTSLQSCQSGFSSLSTGTNMSGQSIISSCPSR